MTTVSHARTFLDALVEAIEAASSYNRQDQVPPAAVLWTDEARQWEELLPLLRERLPLFVLGEYSPDDRAGPAYWLRCIIARTIAHPSLPEEAVPILYLPGYSRQHLRALEDCPVELRPLAELQYRGVLWSQKNSRDWTVSAFLQSKDGGLGIPVEGDQSTREALQRSLLKLAEEPVGAIHRASPLRAFYLDGLIHPDNVKNVLRWLNDPKGYREECSDQEWAAFVALCESHYDFHPDKDGAVTAAEMLGQKNGNWDMVWRRFAEAPTSYETIPDRLREAKPQMTLPLLDDSESWPQNNEAAEMALRDALLSLSDLDIDAARSKILELDKVHSGRRTWVWATLGAAPLAQATEHLATMARVTERMAWGTAISEMVQEYADDGWVADLAVLDALASVESLEDVKAVRSATRAVYRPWLEGIVEAFQRAIAASGPDGYQAGPPVGATEGTCLLFVDGLRFDLAHRLGTILEEEGVKVEVKPRLTALPSVTATSKPAISPAALQLQGGEDFDTVVTASGSKVTAHMLRRVVGDAGFQVLEAEDLGDIGGRAWLETEASTSMAMLTAGRSLNTLPRNFEGLLGGLRVSWSMDGSGWL